MSERRGKRAGAMGAVASTAFKVLLPVLSIFGLWYLVIYTSELPRFVIPDPKMVLLSLVENRALIAEQFMHTLKVAGAGFLLSNVLGIGLAMLIPYGALRKLVSPVQAAAAA